MKTFSLTALAAFGALAFTACSGGSDKTDTETTGSDTEASDTETSDTEGCTGIETADTADPCYEYVGDTLVWEVFYPECDSTSWTHDATTKGWTSGTNYLYIRQTGNVTDPEANGWGEDHTMGSVDFAEGNRWDYLQATLSITTDYTEVADGTTLYECADERAEGLTYWLEVEDVDGNISDCAVWGHDTSWDGNQLGASTDVPSGCYVFE